LTCVNDTLAARHKNRAMDDLATLPVLLSSLGVGLLMGLEREQRGGTQAGLRTFALVGVTGTVSALLAQEAGASWLLPAVALGLLLMMIAADRRADGPPDTTTTVALLLCFLFGAMLWHGHTLLTVALALGATALLYFKAELHGLSHRVTRQDVVSFLQFAVITFVVLPVLPDQGYGPYGQLNPYQIWLMVVLTAGMSLAGYATLRLAPQAQAVPLLGLLGGFVSSTATTLVFSRLVRTDARQAAAAQPVIVIANLVVLLRIAVLGLVVAPQSLPVLLPVLAAGLGAGAIGPLRSWARARASRATVPDLGNPVDLRHALAFGAIYAVVLVVSAFFHDRAGSAGLYTVAAVSGLGDMDAIAISTLQLLRSTQVTAPEAARAIVIALLANMSFKTLLVLVIAGRALAGRVAANFLPAAAGLGGAALLLAN
jgi:uncharacterized membrane protein (DUF4010 family)